MRSFALLALAAWLPSAACTIQGGAHHLGADDSVLATRTGPGGQRDTYLLHVYSTLGDAALRIVTEYDRERALLGFQVVELDPQLAAARGLVPRSGLLVRGVYPESAAAEAGVRAGDVLLRLDGRPMRELASFADFEVALAEHQRVAATVLRDREPLDLELAAKPWRQRVRETQDVALEPSPMADRPYAGVALRGIPAVHCERIFGEAREAVVVTAIEVGSPAWLAGIRPGDLVDEVDGRPVPPVAELSDRLRELGAASATTRWRVHRPGAPPHDAAIELGDYSGETVVWIPLVFGVVDGVHEDRWSLGPFGLLLSDRSRVLAEPGTRTARTHGILDVLFGLIRVESAPESTTLRLFWFAEFGL